MAPSDKRRLPIQPASAEDLASFQSWFAKTLQIAATLDYDAAAEFYAPDYDTPFWFGNVEPTLTHGFDETREKQWKLVWPKAKGAGATSEFEMYVSDDRLWAAAAGVIKFRNEAAGNTVYTRISYVLVRAAIDAPWNAVHAHHSADPRFQTFLTPEAGQK